MSCAVVRWPGFWNSVNSASSARPGDSTIIVTITESENNNVSHVSTITSPTPVPRISTSPMIRAITSPTGIVVVRSVGHSRTPRRASARTLPTKRVRATPSQYRLPILGTSVAAVPTTKSRAARPTALGVAVPRSASRATLIACPRSSGGRTTKMFIATPDMDPIIRRPINCR